MVLWLQKEFHASDFEIILTVFVCEVLWNRKKDAKEL